MIVVLPVTIPVAIPVPAPIVAIAVLELVHVPPTVASLNVIVCPGHMAVTPKIPGGAAFTVITVVVAQPEGNK